MLNHNIPAGAHTIKYVSYSDTANLTWLTLDCGHSATVSMMYAEQYKPEAGDYWIVTDHGTQSLIKKTVFDAATKPMGLFVSKRPSHYAIDSMFSVPLLQMEDIARMLMSATAIDLLGMKNDKPTATGSAKAKPDTLGMREENGYDGRAEGVIGNPSVSAKTGGQNYATSSPGLIARTDVDMNCLLSEMDAQVWAKEFCSINKASDESAMLSWFSCAIMTGYDEANRRRDKDVSKGQNVIKSLTGQNEAKQKKINDLVRQVRTQADTLRRHEQANDEHRKQVQSLRDQIAIQATDGNWDMDEYMRGMLNGMLCAMSNFDGVNPKYKEALPAKRKEAAKSAAFNALRKAAVMSPGTAATLVDALADAKLI